MSLLFNMLSRLVITFLPMNIQYWSPLGWISCLDLLAVQGTLKSLLQHHSSKASILWHSGFFTVQLSHPYMTTGKTIALTATATAKSLQSCPTLCDPIDGSPTSSPIPGILQARTLEWVHACAKSLQLCPTLCDPMDCSPPGSSVHGIFQARILEWVAIAFSELTYKTMLFPGA